MYDDKRYKNHKRHVGEFMEIEKQKEMQRKIRSKRTLLTILRVDELSWEDSALKYQQQASLSTMITKVIFAKVQFNELHIFELNQNMGRILDAGSEQILALWKLKEQTLDKLTREHNQSFTQHLQLLNESPSRAYETKIQIALDHAEKISHEAIKVLEGLVQTVEEFN